jgi:hypothetical protein
MDHRDKPGDDDNREIPLNTLSTGLSAGGFAFTAPLLSRLTSRKD